MKLALALVLASATLTAGAAHAVDVYKWKDSKGVVHYGDRPASGASSSLLQVQGSTMTDEEEEAASERLDQARAKLVEPSYGDDTVVSYPTRVRKTDNGSCAESWRRYDEAEVCFNANRVAGGKGVSRSGQAYCKQVSQPTCAR